MLEIKTFVPRSHKIKCLIYGASGTWKTTFWWTAENVIFASSENWLLSIADKKVAMANIQTLENLQELRDFLKNEEHQFETLVIDSITDINNIIKESIEKKVGRQMQIKERWELWNKIKQILSDIKNIDMNVIIIAQEQYEKDDQAIQKIIPSLNWKLATEICYFMDIVWYIHIDNKGKRTLITAPSEKLLTKDRTWKIWNDTELDFEEWKTLVNKISLDEEEILFTVMNQAEKNMLKKVEQFEKYRNALIKCKDLECLKNTFMKINKGLITQTHYIELWKIKDQLKDKVSKET